MVFANLSSKREETVSPTADAGKNLDLPIGKMAWAQPAGNKGDTHVSTHLSSHLEI